MGNRESGIVSRQAPDSDGKVGAEDVTKTYMETPWRWQWSST